MPDMIPASKVAASALAQARLAAGSFPTIYHDADKAAKCKVHLQVAIELLALIAEPPQMAHLAEDGTLTPIPPGGTDDFYTLPLPEGWERLSGHELVLPNLDAQGISGASRLKTLARRITTKAGQVIKSVDGEQDPPPFADLAVTRTMTAIPTPPAPGSASDVFGI